MSMRYRRLGRTDLQVSVLGLGSWQFGGAWGRDFSAAEVADIVSAAAELGMNLIDTAECYGDHLAETLLGTALKGQRHRWILATKFGHRFGGDLSPETYWQVEQVEQQLERSLRALQTDYIDLYQFHSGSDEQLDNDALWTFLHKQRDAGRIRHLGISIGKLDDEAQLRKALAYGVDAVQVVYNCLKRGAEKAVLPLCRKQDLGVLNRTPLASGFLAGQHRPGVRFPDTDVRSRRKPEMLDRELQQAWMLLDQYRPAGVETSAWALAWCLKHPSITTVIPGVKTVAQLQQNAGLLALLPEESRIQRSEQRVET